MDPPADLDHQDELNDIEKQLEEWDTKEDKKEEKRISTGVLERRQPFQRKRRSTAMQAAAVGAYVFPIESLDYEIIENELFMQDWRSRKRVQILQYVILKWATAPLIGLITGFVGIFNNIVVENIAGFRLLLTSNLMLEGKYLKASLAFAGCNIGLATAAGALCAFIAPAAAGSGIPEVKAYLNGVDAPSILAPVLSLLRWRHALMWRTFFTTAAVSILLRLFVEYCWTGKCGRFGNGGLIMYDGSAVEATYGACDLLAVVFLGVIGGLLGSFFNYLVDNVLRIYRIINNKGPTFRILLVVFISILTTSCAFGLPWLAKCTPCPSDMKGKCSTLTSSGNYKNFQCEPDHYNDLASHFLNTKDDAIRNLLSTRTTGSFQISSLFIFFITVYTLGIITYGIAVPPGLFVPIILSGAVCGRLVGRLFKSLSGLDTGLFSLLGAASFLGGTMRTPVSICVILLELTNDLLLLPLVMIALLISKTVVDVFNEGVCDQIVKLRGLLFININPEPYMKHLMVGDVVSKPVVTFFGVEKVEKIVNALRQTRHNGFPVINEPPFSDTPEFCGLVLRSHILVLLKAKCFMKERVPPSLILEKFSSFDFAKPSSGEEIKLEDIVIREEEMGMYINLHPITNTSPYRVVETMSLAKAHILFRQLGLRHMCVVPKSKEQQPIVGILTRHDFMPEHVLGLYPHLKVL